MREDLQQLRKYTIYAVGCPLFITLISATIEFLPHTINISIRPDFGIWRCFFANALSTFIYLYLPMMILQTSNVIFFWLTISNIRQTWRLTHSFDLTTKAEFPEHFVVILKLFLIMGLNWMTDFLGFALVHILWEYKTFHSIMTLFIGKLWIKRWILIQLFCFIVLVMDLESSKSLEVFRVQRHHQPTSRISYFCCSRM